VSIFVEKRVGLLIAQCIWRSIRASGIDFSIPIATTRSLELGNGLLKHVMRVTPVTELADRV
jgi:hypothetical protein